MCKVPENAEEKECVYPDVILCLPSPLDLRFRLYLYPLVWFDIYRFSLIVAIVLLVRYVGTMVFGLGRRLNDADVWILPFLVIYHQERE